MFESLESRQHFATAPAPLPDLRVSLTYTPSTYVRPGAQVKPVLVVRNVGTAMTKALKMPINFYISTTPTLPPGTKPFSQIKSESINLKAKEQKSYNLTANVPNDVKAGKYYLFVSLNENGKVLKEKTLANNRAVSAPLISPVGTYSGKFQGDDTQAGTVTLKLSPVNSGATGMLADFTFRSNLTTIRVEGIRATLGNRSGNFEITARGSYDHPALGRLRYRINMDGKISGKTYEGDVRVVWHSATSSRNTLDKSVTLTRTT